MASQVMVWGRSPSSVELLLGEQWSCSGKGCMYLYETFWAPGDDKAGERGDQPSWFRFLVCTPVVTCEGRLSNWWLPALQPGLIAFFWKGLEAVMRPSHGLSLATTQLREAGTSEETGHCIFQPLLSMPCYNSSHSWCARGGTHTDISLLSCLCFAWLQVREQSCDSATTVLDQSRRDKWAQQPLRVFGWVVFFFFFTAEQLILIKACNLCFHLWPMEIWKERTPDVCMI